MARSAAAASRAAWAASALPVTVSASADRSSAEALVSTTAARSVIWVARSAAAASRAACAASAFASTVSVSAERSSAEALVSSWACTSSKAACKSSTDD